MTDKCVPREPTPAMFIAGTKALAEADGSFARQVWYAMLDAAPAVPDEREAVSRERERAAYFEGRCDALRAALRDARIHFRAMTRMRCGQCNGEWVRDKPERHAPGCLAAPEDAPK